MQYPRTPPMSEHYQVPHEVSQLVHDDTPTPIISKVNIELRFDNTLDQYDTTSENTSRRGPGIGFGRDKRDVGWSYHSLRIFLKGTLLFGELQLPFKRTEGPGRAMMLIHAADSPSYEMKRT
jgi:hypothetical protein